MSERIKVWGPVVSLIVMAIGITANFALLVVYFVSDHQLIQRHEGIINAYEQHGTPSVVILKSTMDQQFKDTDRRLDKVEACIGSIADMKTDLKGISVTLGVLSQTLGDHINAKK